MGSGVGRVKHECLPAATLNLKEAVYDVPNGFTSHGVGRGRRVQRT
jgi:hypothetical protein